MGEEEIMGLVWCYTLKQGKGDARTRKWGHPNSIPVLFPIGNSALLLEIYVIQWENCNCSNMGDLPEFLKVRLWAAFTEEPEN